jgi:hypothetical protein
MAYLEILGEYSRWKKAAQVVKISFLLSEGSSFVILGAPE